MNSSMVQELANQSQGHSLPPRRFASPQDRAFVVTACHRLLAWGVFGLVAVSGVAQQANARVERSERFLSQRATADGTSPAAALQRAKAAQAEMLFAPRSTNLTAAWQALGPSSIVSATYGNLTGRVTAIAVDPNDATGDTVYVGTTGGGVWKSTNAAGALSAVTFAPLTDTLPVFSASAGTSVVPSLSIGSIAVQPLANPVVLAGTGDPNDATDSYYGEGLLRSADGGLTWTLVQNSAHGANATYSFTGLATAGIAFSTATPTLVVAAFSTSAEGTVVSAVGSESVPGLYYSADAGQTWQMATLYDGSQVVQGPQPLGTGQVGNSVTSVVWNPARKQFFAAVQAHGYYSSPDGVTWTRLANQPGTALTTANCPVGSNGTGSAGCPMFRGALAVRADTGDMVALSVDVNSVDQGLWLDVCNAATSTSGCAGNTPSFATRIDGGALEVGNGSTSITQGTYDLSLAVVAATGGTEVLVGTVDLYRCVMATGTSSCALRNTTNAINGCNAPAEVAASQHAVVAVAQVSGVPVVFTGNDGGLWRSLDGVAETGSACASSDHTHFDNLNAAIGAGGSLAEVVGFAQHPTDSNTLLVGLGANGSAETGTASAQTAWPQVAAGEGGLPSVDANTPNNRYLAIGAGVNVKQCAVGSACTAASFASPATVGEAQVAYDATVLDAPTLLDPGMTANLIVATCRVWRGSAAGVGWSATNALSGAFNGSAVPCTAASPLVRSVAAGGRVASSASVQLAGSTVIYAGIAGTLDGGATVAGHVYVNAAANTAAKWTDTALPNTYGYDVSAIAVDPHDATGATVYATVMGFGTGHVYRSVNFGGTWVNVSANLPDAPVNAVLVDPNDANTVYVATDAGVYVTSAVTTCAASNCWSSLGTGLPNAPVVAMQAGANLLTGDGRRGMLRVATYGRGIWQQPLVTAVSLAQPAMTLSVASMGFGSQQVATQSAAQSLTITSTGNAAVVFATPAVTGDYLLGANTCTGTLAVGASCTMQVSFAPTATGTSTGLLTVYANVSGGQATVTLTGVGTAPASITLTPVSLSFAATVVGQTTAAQIVTVANTGGTAASLQAPVLSGNAGDFAVAANTCGSTLGASTACAISVTFTPTTGGIRSAQLSITDSVGTQVAQLTGTGEAAATDTLSVALLTFGQQQVGTSSGAQQVTLTNAGDVPLTLVSASVSGGDFAAVNGCGTSLAGHASCAVSVTFTPTATGQRAATLTIADAVRSQTVALMGSGVAPPGVSLSPATLSFAATGVGLSSVAQAVTLTNNGGVALVISNVAVGAGFVVAANGCGATLGAGAACVFQVVSAPLAAGPVMGALTLTDNAPTSVQTVALSGTGVDFSLAAAGATTMTVTSGGTVVYPMLLSSLAGLSGNVALGCTGAPANTTCTVSPTAPSLGGTVSVTVTVVTGTQAEMRLPQWPWTVEGLSWLAIMVPVSLLARRRRRLIAVCVLMGLLGCGSGRTVPGGSGGSSLITPSGTYNLVVSGSAAGLTHTVPLTLVVQ